MRNQKRNDSGRDRSGKKNNNRRDRQTSDRQQSNRGSQDRPERHTRTDRNQASRNPARMPDKKRPANSGQSRQQTRLIESPIRLDQRMQSQLKGVTQEFRHAPVRSYKVIFFDNLHAAKSDLARLKDLAQSCDQLNIVIRSDANAEANMDDQELAAYGKVFAGAAWALIHERRVSEGWYEKAH